MTRSVVIATVDVELRQLLTRSLGAMRWTVREAGGGAEALGLIDAARPEAILLDTWLPDLEVGEFAVQLAALYPSIDLLGIDGGATAGKGTARSPRRHELLHAIHEAQEHMGSAGTASEPELERERAVSPRVVMFSAPVAPVLPIPEMIGESASMLELARMIRLVAPRSATVLIEGETGTGKEVVAKALHRLSARSSRPFVVLNCAAIPESLLEAELFGHTRGAFTGAVQSRTGRIEAANGGTLFLDEIGEMPIALQAKMLRFLECGELQRVGDNEMMRVDVRVIAATHQPLEQRAAERTFRLDLYHRLAVFPLEVPSLRERLEDLPLLVEFFLEQLGRDLPRKGITPEAQRLLVEYAWPGNVRELMHVLERAVILAEDRPQVDVNEIRLRRTRR